MMFTWEDPRARQAMLQSTAAAGNMSYDEAATIFFSPDTASAALWNVTTPHPTSDYTCSLPCSSLYAFVPGRSMCCDGMWLPQLECECA